MTQSSNVIVFRPRPVQQSFRRPTVLIRAAREGQRSWKRERDLARLLRTDRCPEPARALSRLRAEEEIQNDLRLNRLAEYDMKRHVLLMIAIMAEFRAAIQATPEPAALAL
ncbi:MAG: DUF6477 family protein [Paracoccus sp. (in: a-proteobacteria)]|nr:DUF6477 family protein [Paracoccus sp. (in: a-proteobacteria)]